MCGAYEVRRLASEVLQSQREVCFARVWLSMLEAAVLYEGLVFERVKILCCVISIFAVKSVCKGMRFYNA